MRIRGFAFTGEKYTIVEGEFLYRTDDPDEVVQDVVILGDDGKHYHIDEHDILRNK